MANTEIKISLLPAATTVVPSVDTIPIVTNSVTTKATPNQIIKAALAATASSTNPVLIGASASANATRFPNTQVIVSDTAAPIQKNEPHNIGLLSEGVAHPSNSNTYGIGVYGVGYTNNGTRCGGVVGEAHVSASTDTGSAIGVRGYSNDTHSGGINVGLYGDASGAANNYSLYLNNGDIYQANSKNWNLNYSKLTFNTGSVGFNSVLELATISSSAPTSTANFDTLTQGVQFYTANTTTNFTLNVRGNSSITLNSLLSVGQSETIVLLITNGTSAYYPTALTIDDIAVTPKWQFGIQPTSGYASGIDMYSYTIVKTGNNAYTVLASQTTFA